MVAEDDIDVESLQAQIDMSMSFAHNLVMSWIKPPHLSRLRSSDGANTSQILEEELRRPPRLGVGASISAASPLSHEASKLKRRLGRNRVKHEGLKEPQLQDFSKSDNEEHKGRPTKRKTRADPFGHEGGKKKRKDEPTVYPYSPNENASKSFVSLLKDSTLVELAEHDSSGKAKQGTGLGDQQPSVPEVPQSATLVSSSRLPIHTQCSQSITTVPSLMKPPRETSAPVPGNPTTPESSRMQKNFVSIPDKAWPLAIPLLNLDGPPGLTDKSGGNSEFDKTRKKRKKRKRKKKNQTIAGTAGN